MKELLRIQILKNKSTKARLHSYQRNIKDLFGFKQGRKTGDKVGDSWDGE
jgi:hypothetical protein